MPCWADKTLVHALGGALGCIADRATGAGIHVSLEHGDADPTAVSNAQLLRLTSAFRLGFVQSFLLQHTTDLMLLGLTTASCCFFLQSAGVMMLYMLRHCLRLICARVHTGSQVTGLQRAAYRAVS
jgi:hypothetical protein